MRCLLALFLSVTFQAHANEITLKDGRRIQWSSLRDEGDTIEVVTSRGATISVSKKDVVHVTVSPPKSPLTGATVEFDRKKRKLKVVDVSRYFDPKKAMDGTLSLFRGGIEIRGTVAMVNARFPSTFKPPEEYDLSMVVQRISGLDELSVGLVGGGRQFNVIFDRERSSYMNVEGQPKKMGVVFEGRSSRQLKFLVRKEGLVIQVDGKDYYSVPGWEGVKLHPILRVPDESVIFFTAYPGSGFRVSRLMMVAPRDR